MRARPLHEYSIAEAGAAMRRGEITARQLTDHALARVAALNPKIAAFVTVTEDRARADAAAADADFARGVDRGPLQGIPYGLKDIYDTAGIRTACHSKLRLDHVPDADSAVAERLKAQGAVLVGKLTTNEFALGNPAEDAPFPPALNPWNIAHSPGGSSSGSGAAIAAGLVRVAMGSDTGASIRGPASFCGVVGLKPTFGLVSRRGVFPLSNSLDHCGPLTRSIEDAAIVMSAIAGRDLRDPASANIAAPDYHALLESGVRGLRIGVPRHFFEGAKGLSPEVLAGIEASLQKLEDAGAVVCDIVLPDYALFVACGRTIMYTEAFAIHEKDFRERPRDFGFSTYMRMIMGAFTTGADMVQALRLRRELTEAMNGALLDCNALVTATALGPAPVMSYGDWAMPSDAPMQCMQFNVTGHPALAIPTRFSAAGMPLALQIAAKHFDEPTLLRIGAVLEKDNEVLSRLPDLATA